MIVFCEECGARIYLTQKDVDRSPGYIHCGYCGEVIKVAQPKILSVDLEVSLGDKVVKMDSSSPVLTMGRKWQNDLVIRKVRVSRTHSVIVYLADQYLLFDLSLNGTFVSFDRGEKVVLHKSKIPLHGEGSIGLGPNLPSDPKELIRFRLIDKNIIGVQPD